MIDNFIINFDEVEKMNKVFENPPAGKYRVRVDSVSVEQSRNMNKMVVLNLTGFKGFPNTTCKLWLTLYKEDGEAIPYGLKQLKDVYQALGLVGNEVSIKTIMKMAVGREFIANFIHVEKDDKVYLNVDTKTAYEQVAQEMGQTPSPKMKESNDNVLTDDESPF